MSYVTNEEVGGQRGQKTCWKITHLLSVTPGCGRAARHCLRNSLRPSPEYFPLMIFPTGYFVAQHHAASISKWHGFCSAAVLFCTLIFQNKAERIFNTCHVATLIFKDCIFLRYSTHIPSRPPGCKIHSLTTRSPIAISSSSVAC
ncbi:hypothetical protein HJG60_008070 [Phyllostomus discolor]|uniref:Uncharacterized protein n=1 Tax=Phyllostomus discolor TaxID=89673 RepID=A0A834ERX3_9CHIR|nr:hypothetical protein HJG60_008070 [Phyllostomus discolor]